jgi:TonB family protein
MKNHLIIVSAIVCFLSLNSMNAYCESPDTLVNADSVLSAMFKSTSVDSVSKAKYIKDGAIKGALPKAEIMKVVMANIESIRYFYKKRWEDNPELQGRISMYFTILPSGAVTNCLVLQSTVNDSLLEYQIRNRMKRWKFPPSADIKDTTWVIYPFVFSPIIKQLSP